MSDHPCIVFFGCTKPGGPVQFRGSDAAGNAWIMGIMICQGGGRTLYTVNRNEGVGTGETAAAAWREVKK